MYKRLSTFLSCIVAATWAQAAITLQNLSIEGREDQPLGLDILQPRFGWQIVGDANETHVVQTQYHIQVASSRELLEQNKPDLWEQTLASGQSQYIHYAGKPLHANQRCYWRVQIQATQGEKKPQKTASAWSEISEFGIGLLSETHWKGYWIGLDRANEWDVEEEHSRLSARYYRTSFKTSQNVKRATLHIAGLGLYEAMLNGEKIGNDVLAPAPSNYEKSIHYNSYDVTSMLKGNNQLQVTVSNGRFYTMQQNKKKYKIRNFGYPTLRANLIIEYADGTTETIATDDKKWKMTCDGAIRSANEYDGEIYDANKEEMPDSIWFKPDRSAIPNGELIGNAMPSMRVLESLPVKELIQKEGNRVIIDFGQNFAGWVRTDLTKLGLQQGDTLRIRYAEKLDSIGELYVENLRHAQSTDIYIANGKESGTWAPRFSYHGGRFAEITVISSTPFGGGWEGASFCGEVISDAMETLYTFECGNPLLNQLVKNAFWGVRSNYKGMPIDCPQRDERQPWLGDHSQGCWGESYLMDNQHLYNKWLRDIEEAMRQDGCIPDVAPAYWNYYSDNVSWPSVFVFGAEMLYQQYGDNKTILTHYPAMRKWLMHLYNDKRTDEGLVKADKYGDWCVTPESLELIHSKDESRVTDGILIGSCYMYKLLEVMMHFDDIMVEHIKQASDDKQIELERKGINIRSLLADKQQYAAIRDSLRQAINRKFLTVKPGSAPTPKNSDHYLYPDSIFYGNNALTANLLPLAFGIVPKEYRDVITRQIVAKIMLKPANGHLCCGVIGISWLLRELSKQGRMDVAYLLATNDTYPSWGYMAKQGATTIWELWNGDTANPKMNSGNHIMLLGDLLPWCFENVGGIQAAEPGFKVIRLAPNFELEELSWSNVSYKTPYGKVVSNWKKTPMHLSWDIEIPANTQAIVVTPNGERTYLSGKHHIEEDLPHKEATKQQNLRLAARTEGSNATQLLSNEFLFEEAAFPSCHSASITECTNGDLIATYFGGSYEGCEDMCIWTQRKKLIKRGQKGTPHTYEEGWSAPVLVADGALKPEEGKGWREWQASDKNSCISEFNKMTDHKSDTLRKAGYNPVIYQVPGGDLLLFYKLGYDVRDWTGYIMRSKDNGYTWTTQRDSIAPADAKLFGHIAGMSVERDSLLGPIKNQPICLPAGFKCKNGEILKHDRILAPTSKETGSATKKKAGQWRCFVEISEDEGMTWTLSPAVPERREVRTIQPTLLVHADGRLQMLCRTATPKEKGREDLARIATSFSDDGGLTWSEMQLIDELPNNNSGIDAVTVFKNGKGDNEFYLIYNPFSIVDWRDKKDPAYNKSLRNPLHIATSKEGLHWSTFMVLESSPISQYSYPSMIVGSDGTLHCIYTWRRERIKYQRVEVKSKM